MLLAPGPWVLLAPAFAADPHWRRTINEAFAHGEHAWIGPFPARMAELAAAFGGAALPGAEAVPAGSVGYLYGDPASNALLGEVLAWHGISLDADGIVIGERRIAAADPFLIAALPHPERPAEPIVVYTARSHAIQPHLNEVFHGPTSLVVGRVVDGAPEALWSGGLVVDGAGRVRDVAAGPGTLTAIEAIEDLRALNAQLLSGYAGLVEIDDALRTSGGSWEARVAAAEQALAARESWAWIEVWDALLTLLAPVSDSHFTLQGGAIGQDGAPVARQAHLTSALRPWFAEGRLTGDAAAWSFEGAPVAEAPPLVPDPAEVAPGAPYRFPTFLPDGSPAYLVGVFAADGEEPGPIAIGGAGRPVHPARGARRRSDGPWSLEPGEVPVLSVATMNTPLLDGLLDTPRQLADASRIVLDLRGNGGGSDTMAMKWVTAFAPQPYRWHGGADLVEGAGPQTERLTLWEPSTFGRGRKRRWDGELFVLVDAGTASSGETFAMLASQVPGAVLAGVGTFGCTRYGNISAKAPLPHTGIVATFGHTRFDVADVVPIAEGRGMFPALWLDEPDPVAFVRALQAR